MSGRAIGAATLSGIILATSISSAVPAFATGGFEGSRQGVVVPGSAVWGQASNHLLGSYKIPTNDGLDDGLFIDANSDSPRTEYNSLIKYAASGEFGTNTQMKTGKTASADGVNQVKLAMILAKNVNDTKSVSNDVKSILSEYGYSGDYGKSWIEAVNKANSNSNQSSNAAAVADPASTSTSDAPVVSTAADVHKDSDAEAVATPEPTESATPESSADPTDSSSPSSSSVSADTVTDNGAAAAADETTDPSASASDDSTTDPTAEPTTPAPQPSNPGDDPNAQAKAIQASEADYVMAALSAAAYNGADPSGLGTPVDTSKIIGAYDDYGYAEVNTDFNNLVNAVKEASKHLTDQGKGAKLTLMSYDGNQIGSSGPLYKRGLSFQKSTIPAVNGSVAAKSDDGGDKGNDNGNNNDNNGGNNGGSDNGGSNSGSDDNGTNSDNTGDKKTKKDLDLNGDGKVDVNDIPATTSTTKDKDKDGNTVSTATGEVLADKDGNLSDAGKKIVEDNAPEVPDDSSSSSTSTPGSSLGSSSSDGGPGVTDSGSTPVDTVSSVDGTSVNSGSGAGSDNHMLFKTLVGGLSSGLAMLAGLIGLDKWSQRKKITSTK